MPVSSMSFTNFLHPSFCYHAHAHLLQGISLFEFLLQDFYKLKQDDNLLVSDYLHPGNNRLKK